MILFMKFKYLALFTAAFLLISASVMGQMDFGMGAPDMNQPVAEVNTVEITLQELEQRAGVQQLVMQLQQMNPQFAGFLLQSEAGREFLFEYRRELLEEELIPMELLRQKADEEGIVVTEEQEDEYYAQIEEQLEMQREQQGLSEEEFLQQINQNIPDEDIQTSDDLKELILRDADLKVEILLEEHVLGETDEELDQEALQQQQLQQREDFENYLADLKEDAEIVIHEEVLRDIDDSAAGMPFGF